MTQAELTTRYNQLATKLGLPTMGLWKKGKSILEGKIADMEAKVEQNRIVALEAAKPLSTPAKVAAKEVKTASPKSVEKVSQEFVDHLQSLIRTVVPAQAFRQTMIAFPGTSRIVGKHSAAAAGMKPKTARNLFDLILRETSC